MTTDKETRRQLDFLIGIAFAFGVAIGLLLGFSAGLDWIW